MWIMCEVWSLTGKNEICLERDREREITWASKNSMIWLQWCRRPLTWRYRVLSPSCLKWSLTKSVLAIRCHCLASHHLTSSPLTFLMIPSLALCLCFLFRSCLLFRWSPPQSAILESAMLCAPVLVTICGCGPSFIAFLYKARWKCAHIDIDRYIYIYT